MRTINTILTALLSVIKSGRTAFIAKDDLGVDVANTYTISNPINLNKDTGLKLVDTTDTSCEISLESKYYPYLDTIRYGDNERVVVTGNVTKLSMANPCSIRQFIAKRRNTYETMEMNVGGTIFDTKDSSRIHALIAIIAKTFDD